MNNEITTFGIAGGLGVLLAGGWVALYFLSWIWAWIWAWIDDSEIPHNNPLILQVMKLMGYKSSYGCRIFEYICTRKGKEEKVSDGICGFFYPFLALLILPVTTILAYVLYPATIGIFCIYLIARLARFARRHKKLFDKHIKDPQAHK